MKFDFLDFVGGPIDGARMQFTGSGPLPYGIVIWQFTPGNTKQGRSFFYAQAVSGKYHFQRKISQEEAGRNHGWPTYGVAV